MSNFCLWFKADSVTMILNEFVVGFGSLSRILKKNIELLEHVQRAVKQCLLWRRRG